ncbi:C2H2 finger domain protein [Aspergillus heteromorphus CBS 117.55]|uniref:C2H2 finger domain protein n=1 Tax=Aspergillus heteromorphus CBS 117.55 TaxID=1448321 RepID=A0A317VVD2_9EURO|nr:C2H2 finger domain protein [Aspergillus heteromorphus CBS 117.55]PWY78354.1 C2H2 finger domain protein [Aspergillus heteromorphus CBS 117.55]
MSSLPYTCNTCLVAFRGSDAQREHMRQDWHLYNMKRRIASLPPVSQETFNDKVLAAKATTTAAAAKASFETTCVACQKTFYSENSYQNHVKSSKHKAREARASRENADDSSSVMSSTFSLGEPINKSDVSKVADTLKNTTIEEGDEEEDDDDDEDKDEEMSDDAFSPSRCLFCPQQSADIQENTEHMYKAHGMFIPEKNYLVNIEGLLFYLYRKINENSECLYCHSIRNTPESIRTHMRDKGHCMIAFESEAEQVEIGQYYDFRSTYDEEDDWESTGSETAAEGGVKVEGEDEGWETDASSMDEDEELDDNRKSAPVLYATDYELHLPNGKSVGHRSLAKYFRQNLHNYPTPDERAARQLAIENGEIEPDEPKARGRNLNRALISRANGGTGMIGTTDSQKHDVQITERKERMRAIRQEQRFTARINRGANHQKHFRDPLLQ